MRPSECRQRSAARPPGTPGPAARRQSRCQFLPADHLQRRRLRHHVTAQRGVAAALPRPSRPGRRAPPATRSGQPGKPGCGHGHGMNDGLRRTQRTLAPGGEGKGSLRSMPDYAPASYVAIMSQIRGSLSLHPSLQPASALPVACTCGAARRRLAPASRESWSCCAAWCRQPARRSGGHGTPAFPWAVRRGPADCAGAAGAAKGLNFGPADRRRAGSRNARPAIRKMTASAPATGRCPALAATAA